MGVDLEKLVVQMSADIKGYENAMRKAVNVTKAQVKEIEDRYKKMGGVLSSSLTAPLAGLGAALSTREVLRYVDAWTQAGNMVRAAGEASGVQTRSLEELRKGADGARTSLETYVELYAKLIRASAGVAKSEQEVATATDVVAKAMKAGGASTQEQQSAIIQLGQALASGVLQGDELRSLRENAPVIADAIAKEMKTTIGGLKELGAQGKITSDKVFRAILAAQPQIEAQFAATNQTIGEGFIRIGNALTQYIGVMAQSVGLTQTVNTILGALAGNIDVVANAAAAAGVVLLSRYVPALTRVAASQALVAATNPYLAIAVAAAAATVAVAEFGDEIHPVAGDMATLQDYAGSIWDDIASGASTAASATSDAFLAVINGISDAIGGIQVSWSDVGSFVKDVINGMIGGVVALYEVVKANFTVLPNLIGAAAVGAMNAMIAAIEAGINRMVEKINGISTAVNAASSAVGMGSFAPVLDKVSFGRFQNDYVAAAKETGTAAATAISDALGRDYLGDLGGALKRGADIRALDRRQQERDARDSETPTSTAGYGAGTLATTGSGGSGGGKAKKAKKDELEKEIEQITRRTAALSAETAAQAGLNPLVEDYGYAVAKAKATQDLETAAKEAGLKVTDEQRQRMEQLAEGYAEAVEESNRLADSQDRLRQNAEDWRSLSEGVSKGFVQDLIEGKSAADALGNALGRIGDKLIDMAFEGLFDSQTGAFGGIGGAIASALSSAFGGARANGGPVTAGKAYLVGEKRPEVFVPNQSGVILPKIPTARAGGSGSAGGDLRVTFAADVDQSGNLLPFVTDVSDSRVRHAAPGQIQRSVRAVRELNRESSSYLGS